MYYTFFSHSSVDGHLGCFHILAIVNSAAVNTACAFLTYGFLRVCVLVVKNPPASAGDIRDASLIPGLGRSPGEGNGIPLQYPCLGNPMDRGAWWAIKHRVTQSRTRLKQLSTAHARS